MKKLWKVLLSSILAVSLVGCGSKSDTEQVMDAQEVYGCSTINVYNWGEYIGEDVISNFESAYNAKVNYDVFESNEILYTKLLGGSAYDVLVPSDYMIERLISENMIQPIDKSIVTNLGNLDPQVVTMQKVYDPNQEYSVPYFWGSVGIVYNKNNVDPAEVEAKGYDILLDSQYKDRVYVYDSERDSFMMAFKALGYSMNTEDEAQIQEAYQWLLDMNEAVNPSFVTDEVIDAMVNGDKDIAIMYSGDATYVLSENDEMAYWTPTSGTNLWSDGMVIPTNAGCPGLANEYINYILTYDASFDNSLTVGYASSNAEVLKDLSSAGGEYDGNEAYVPRSGYDKDEVFRNNEVLKKELSDLWIKVKNQ